MKTRALRSYLCFTLLATAFLLGLAGCDKEESEPLRIGDDSFNNIENGDRRLICIRIISSPDTIFNIIK